MKPALLSIALLFSFHSLSFAIEERLNAPELAQHLGVYSWVSKMKLAGENYQVEVIRVKDGKEAGVLLSSHMSDTDREFTRLAILLSKTAKGMKLSLQPEVDAKMSVDGAAAIATEAIVPLPSVIASGDYVLGGDIPPEKLTSGAAGPVKVRIEAVKDGLLLRVTKMP